MIENRSITIGRVFRWSGFHMVWLLSAMALVAVLYYFGHINLRIPWLATSVVGTAVAFYAGFKNNSAYDRLWEARKIWGAIVNTSRSWGIYVDGYVSTLHASKEFSDGEIHEVKTRLIHRHISWLYHLRFQLLQPTKWEHISQRGPIGKQAAIYQRRTGIGAIKDQSFQIPLKGLLTESETSKIESSSNKATQILSAQSKDLATIREIGLIDDFRHLALQDILRDLFTQQGKCERIKKFPLPRQYANMSRVFIGIFLCLLPFSIVPEMRDLGSWGLWLSIPISALIGWVYVVMELIGDYSENPFSGMPNDVPMLSLCRTIEIDLREILNETEIPAPIKAHRGVLM